MLREGESPSERDVAKTLAELVAKAKGRVVVTTFASNVARLRSAAEAGLAGGRQVCVMGRAMERVIAVARECGYLDGVPPFLGMDPFDRLPRDKILALATGSQGEPRAALARIAEDEHPTAELAPATPSSSPRAPFPATRRRSARSSTASSRRASRSSPTARVWFMCRAIRAARSSRKCTPGSGPGSRFPRMANRST